MNKKKTWMSVGALVGTGLLVTTAFASAANLTGYDTYKTAIKNTYGFQSVSADVSVTVKDNGQQILDLHSVDKVNRTNGTSSTTTTFNANGQQKSVNTFNEADKTVVKSSDSNVYDVYTFTGKKAGHSEKAKDPAREQQQINGMEKVADALTGSIQEYVTLNNEANGVKDVTLHLSNNQVPPLVNAVLSLVSNTSQYENNRPNKAQDENLASLTNLKDQLPKLVDQIKVTDINAQAKVGTDQRIQNQSLDFTITGIDANGKAHTLTIHLNGQFTNYNHTTPDTIDLNGKQTKTIQPQAEMKNRNESGK